MKFNEGNKVIIETIAFILFLRSEIARHHLDIDNARDLIYEVCLKFHLADMLEEE